MGLSSLFKMVVRLNVHWEGNGISPYKFGCVIISMSCSGYDSLIRTNLEKCSNKFFLCGCCCQNFRLLRTLIFVFLLKKWEVDNILEKKCCPVHLAEGPLKIDPLHTDSLICLAVARTIHPKSGWPLWHPDYWSADKIIHFFLWVFSNRLNFNGLSWWSSSFYFLSIPFLRSLFSSCC